MAFTDDVSCSLFHDEWSKDSSRAVLVDVRSAIEFRQVRAVMADNLPLDELNARAFRRLVAGRRAFLICRSGARAKAAAERLLAAGLGDLLVVDGGTEAWVAAGLPTVREPSVMPLERQVRIVVGLLIVLFSVITYSVHILFLLGVLFVGSGLIFAGLTDWCGMGLVLSRMPWNRPSGPSNST